MIQLTPHQGDIKGQVIQAIKSGQKRIIIQGAAGVGKTTLVTDIVYDFVKDYTINPSYNNGIVYITAPTNKALSVLQGKITKGGGIEFKTVHSALKLKRIINSKKGS